MGALHPKVTLKASFDYFSRMRKQRIKDGNPLPGLQNCDIRAIGNETRFWVEFFIRYDLPYYLLLPLSPFSSSIKKITKLLDKCRRGLRKFLGVYKHFLKSKW